MREMAVKVQKYAGGTGGGPEWWSEEYKEERKQVTEGCGAFTKDVYEKTQHVLSMMKVTTAPLVSFLFVLLSLELLCLEGPKFCCTHVAGNLLRYAYVDVAALDPFRAAISYLKVFFHALLNTCNGLIHDA